MILIIVSFVNIIHQVKKFILILILLGLLITTEFFISSNASSVSTEIIKWFFLFSLFIYPLTMKDFFLRLPIPAVVLLLPCASCGPRGPENFSQHLFSTFLMLAKQLLSFNRSVMSDSLQPRGLRHTRPPCPLPSPEACSNLCPLSRWCHPTISSSVILLLLSIFPSIRVFSNE